MTLGIASNGILTPSIPNPGLPGPPPAMWPTGSDTTLAIRAAEYIGESVACNIATLGDRAPTPPLDLPRRMLAEPAAPKDDPSDVEYGDAEGAGDENPCCVFVEGGGEGKDPMIGSDQAGLVGR